MYHFVAAVEYTIHGATIQKIQILGDSFELHFQISYVPQKLILPIFKFFNFHLEILYLDVLVWILLIFGIENRFWSCDRVLVQIEVDSWSKYQLVFQVLNLVFQVFYFWKVVL